METDHPLDAESLSREAPGTAPMIRTPDQRVRVFISSTLNELAPERQAAREAITQLHLTPVFFEAGARPYPPRELYRAYLAQSDIFIGLYWQRYGWVAPDMTISGLEDEYHLSGAKPRLIYLKTPAPEREPGLQGLLDRIRSEEVASYQKFAAPEELRERIANDLALLLTERFQKSPAQPITASEDRFRKRLLDRVRSNWIENVLERSMDGATFIPLGLYERPDLVENPWTSRVQEVKRAGRQLPAGTSLTQVYDKAEGELLIFWRPWLRQNNLAFAPGSRTSRSCEP